LGNPPQDLAAVASAHPGIIEKDLAGYVRGELPGKQALRRFTIFRALNGADQAS